MFKEYKQYDAMGLAALVKSKQVSPKELLETALQIHAEENPKTNAIVRLMEQEAYQQIQAADPSAPFYGVPFLLKDLSAQYRGVVTTNGSVLTKDAVATHDSEIVKRFKKAGFIIFGKTNTPEFGMNWVTESNLLGICRNPYNLDVTAGGSSGGAAAAIASGVVPAAHATDSGGSIRVPASCCHLFGLKPTRARTPYGPDKGEGWAGMSVGHALTRTVRDSAAILDAIHGPEVGAPYAAPCFEGSFLQQLEKPLRPLKIAFMKKGWRGDAVHPECEQAVDIALQHLQSRGHAIEEAMPQFDLERLQDVMYVIVASNTKHLLNTIGTMRGKPVQPDEVDPTTWAYAELEQSVSGSAYANAINQMHAISRQIAYFFEDYDVLVTPTLARPPIVHGELFYRSGDVCDFYRKHGWGFAPFTAMFNMTGQPAMSLPLHKTPAGLPIGVQVVGRFGEESTLFQIAHQLEGEF